MNKHVGRPVNHVEYDDATRIRDAFGMRLSIYHECLACLFDNRVAKLEGKHRADK